MPHHPQPESNTFLGKGCVCSTWQILIQEIKGQTAEAKKHPGTSWYVQNDKIH